MTFNNLIFNIDILNKIKLNDKIIIKDNKIIIDKKCLLRPIKRFISKNNREKTYLFLYKNIFLELITEFNKYIFFINNMSNFSKNEIYIKNSAIYFDLYFKLNKFKNSLYLLKNTYKKDIYFIRKLTIFIKIINKILPNILSFTIIDHPCYC